MTSFFGSIGHAFKVVAIDIGKGAKDAGHVAKVAGQDAPEVILPAAEIAAKLAPIPAPASLGVEGILQLVADKLQNFPKEQNKNMNTLEQFGITILLGVLQTVVKNPAHAATLEAQLVGIANDIYTSYGLTPPVQPSTATAPTAATATQPPSTAPAAK